LACLVTTYSVYSVDRVHSLESPPFVWSLGHQVLMGLCTLQCSPGFVEGPLLYTIIIDF